MSILTSGYCAYQILHLSINVLLDHKLGRFTRQRGNAFGEEMARRIVAKTSMVLDIRGEEHLATSQSFVLMSNHQSHMDIPLLWHIMRGHTLRFIAKSEFFKVPLWGPALAVGECVNLDRKNHERAITSLERAKNLVQSGVSLWIAPEGTRSRSGRLGKLKKGGFHLAINANALILPIAINGTINILPPDSLSTRKNMPVNVVIGAPLCTKGASIDQLMAQVGDFLEENVDQDIYTNHPITPAPCP